jgi:hypothetical protein
LNSRSFALVQRLMTPVLLPSILFAFETTRPVFMRWLRVARIQTAHAQFELPHSETPEKVVSKSFAATYTRSPNFQTAHKK